MERINVKLLIKKNGSSKLISIYPKLEGMIPLAFSQGSDEVSIGGWDDNIYHKTKDRTYYTTREVTRSIEYHFTKK